MIETKHSERMTTAESGEVETTQQDAFLGCSTILRRIERAAAPLYGAVLPIRIVPGERPQTNGRLMTLPIENEAKEPDARFFRDLQVVGFHEAFHVRYTDFELFSGLDPLRLQIANVFEDVRVDRLGLVDMPAHHRLRAADLQRCAFHGKGVFSVFRELDGFVEDAATAALLSSKDAPYDPIPSDAFSFSSFSPALRSTSAIASPHTRLSVLSSFLILEAYEAGFFMKFPLTSLRRARFAVAALFGVELLNALLKRIRSPKFDALFEARFAARDFAIEQADSVLEILCAEARLAEVRARSLRESAKQASNRCKASSARFIFAAERQVEALTLLLADH